VHMYINEKMRLVEIIPKWWEGRLKENDEL
jgi:hypothetical protein